MSRHAAYNHHGAGNALHPPAETAPTAEVKALTDADLDALLAATDGVAEPVRHWRLREERAYRDYLRRNAGISADRLDRVWHAYDGLCGYGEAVGSGSAWLTGFGVRGGDGKGA